MKEFMKIEKLGMLKIEKVFVESYYPILFTCVNEENDLFLCSCCQANKDGRRWMITKTTPTIVIKILKDEIALRDAFVVFPQFQFTIFVDEEELTVLESGEDYWNYDKSRYLPDKEEYMEAEEDEFTEEIAFYENKKNEYYGEIDLKKMVSYTMDISENCYGEEFGIEENIRFAYDRYPLINSEIFKETYRVKIEAELEQDDLYEIYYNSGNRIEDKKLKNDIGTFADKMTCDIKDDSSLLSAA